MRSYEQKARDILKKRGMYRSKKSQAAKRGAKIALIAAVLATSVAAFTVMNVSKRNRALLPAPAVELEQGIKGGAKNGQPSSSEPEKGVYNDGVVTGSTTPASPGTYGDKGIFDGAFHGDVAYAEKDGMAVVEDHSAEVKDLYPEPGAGMLTAGEWKDLDNYSEWVDKFTQSPEWSRLASDRSLNTTKAVFVKAVDGDLPVLGCTVKLTSQSGTLFTAKTDINGVAYLFYDIDKEGDTPLSVVIGDKTVQCNGERELTVEVKDAGVKASQLDLMLMIDTTGSMGDELEYIKAELTDMVERVCKEDQTLSVRVSVNFYRDDGDEYIVKYYDFREDIAECVAQLAEQHAEGGGDYPEAVHTALENAVSNHKWREDAVKLCFLVLDAPPHSEAEVQGINAGMLSSLKLAAEQGIRIIPVASSGVDTETEFLMRSFAAITGGTYIFITDDSGIGSAHKDAEVGEHTVEMLNECMIRVVCEYCGIYHGEPVPYTPPYRQ